MNPLPRIRPQRDPPPVLRPRAPTPSAGRRWPRCSGARPLRRAAEAAEPATGRSPGDPLPAQGQARHLPAHGRRPAADGPVRLQAEDERVVRQGPARLGPHGPAAHHHDLAARRGSRSRRRSSSSPSTASAACGSASCCRTRRKMVDDMCFIRSMHTEAINHEPAITFMQTGNQVTGRPCLGAWVVLRPGLAEREPADVRRARRQADQHRAGAGDLRPALVVGLPARRARRRLVPQRAATRSCTSTTRPASPPRSAARRSTACKALNEMNYQQRRRPRDAHPHPAVRDGLPHAGQRAGADRPRRASRKRPSSSTATTRRSPAPSPTRCCWPGGWSSAASASCRSTTTTGTRTRNVAGRLPDQCRTSTRPCYGLIQDLKQRGPVRRDAGHLGRRVRPDDLLAGRPDARRTTAATTTRAASRCGWPAAASRPGTIYGETDDFSYNIVKDPVHIRDFHATVLHLLGFDHERFTLPLPGARPAADRRRAGTVIKELLA